MPQIAITYEQAVEKINNKWNNILEIKKEDFIKWNEKCKILDKKINQYFIAEPKKVAQGGVTPPSLKKEKLGISFEEAFKRFSEQRQDIELCKEEYKGWADKCKFYDKEVKKHFYSKPNYLYANQTSPLRKNNFNPALTFEQANKKFIEQGRNDIELCEDEYNGWTKKSKLFDKVVKKYFYAVPKQVYFTKSGHMDRKLDKYKGTCLKKYGVENVSQIEEVKNKKINTFMENYGVSTNLQAPLIRKKIKEGWLEKFGTEFPQQNEKVKEKQKQTVIKNYGVDNFSKTRQFQKLSSNRFIKETGEFAKDWLDKKPDPKPPYISLVKLFPNKEISLKDLEEYCVNWKSGKTTLEVTMEKLLNIQHYNKKVPNTTMRYRPDFQLSDKVYVNADGLYWHSEKIIEDKNHHFNMRKEFEENNLRLFQFHSDEIQYKSEIIKSIVNNALGKTPNKVWARKTTIKTVPHSEAIDFLNENHLMGTTTAKHVGLYYKEQLISLMSFKEKKNICKIERFCSKLDCNVIGAFSKLLNHIDANLLKPSTTEIHNWVDLRYGIGEHLIAKCFKLTRETLGWKWWDGERSFNRMRCRANMDERKLSENEYAEELFWIKIHDAGQRLYVKKRFTN